MFNLRKRAPSSSLAIEWRERSQSPRNPKPQTGTHKKIKAEPNRHSMDIEFDWTDENFVGFLHLVPKQEESGYFDNIDSRSVPVLLNPMYNDQTLVQRETAAQFVSLVVELLREHGFCSSEIRKKLREVGFLEQAYQYLKELAKHRLSLPRHS